MTELATAASVVALLKARDFAALKERLRRTDTRELVEAWRALNHLDKALFFKLLSPKMALEFYRALSPEDQYFLLGSFEIGCIAPVLERLPESARSLFQRFPRDLFGEMCRVVPCC